MKKYMKKRLAKLLILAMMAVTVMSIDVLAVPESTVDLGTFYLTAKEQEQDPGEENDNKDDPEKDDGKDDEKDEPHDPGNEEDHPRNEDPNPDHPGNEDPGINHPGDKENPEASGNGICQAPSTGDLITESRTVVATKTKWRISPSFNVVGISSSDKRAIKATRKKDKTRSSKGNKWYCGYLRVKKPGNVKITLEGSAGEREEYQIYAEDPKIRKDALTVNDVKTVSLNQYLSGITYLKPTAVSSKNGNVVSISSNGDISIRENGRSVITLNFGKRKVKGKVKAKLPAFKKKKIILSSSPVKLAMKNVSNNAAVKYSSSDISVVKMNKDGYAAPMSNGTATVYGKSGNVTAECEVTVKGLK